MLHRTLKFHLSTEGSGVFVEGISLPVVDHIGNLDVRAILGKVSVVKRPKVFYDGHFLVPLRVKGRAKVLDRLQDERVVAFQYFESLFSVGRPQNHGELFDCVDIDLRFQDILDLVMKEAALGVLRALDRSGMCGNEHWGRGGGEKRELLFRRRKGRSFLLGNSLSSKFYYFLSLFAPTLELPEVVCIEELHEIRKQFQIALFSELLWLLLRAFPEVPLRVRLNSILFFHDYRMFNLKSSI